VIADFFITTMGYLASLVLSLFPDSTGPGEAQGAIATGLGTVFGYAAGFGAWVPWSAIGPAVLVVTAVFLVAGVIRLVRIVASFLSFGGGSAA
jgi:hypothetical protein